MKTLEKIFDEVFSIGQGLCAGTIDFYVDIKMGHPADVLDFFFTPKFDRLSQGDITKDELVGLANDLEAFIDNFEIEEMESPVKDLRKYIRNMQ